MNVKHEDLQDADAKGRVPSSLGLPGPAQRSASNWVADAEGGASTPASPSLEVTDEMRQAALGIRPSDNRTARGILTGPWTPGERDVLSGMTQPEKSEWAAHSTEFSYRRGKRVELESDDYWLVQDGWPRAQFIGQWTEGPDGVALKWPTQGKEGEQDNVDVTVLGATEEVNVEAWLRKHDPKYAETSKGWRHVKRGSGTYRRPRETEWLARPDVRDWAIEEQQREGRKNGKPIRQPSDPSLEKQFVWAYRSLPGVAKFQREYDETPGSGRAKQRARARLEKAIRISAILWDWTHSETTKKALAQANGVSPATVGYYISRLEVVMLNTIPEVISVLRATDEDQEARIAAIERHVGLPVGGEKAVEIAIEQVIEESLSARRDHSEPR